MCGGGFCGAQMPLGGELSSTCATRSRFWIASGAANDYPVRCALPVRALRHILTLLSLTLAGALAASAAHAAGEPCRSAQFTISGAPVGHGFSASQTVEIGSLVGLGDICPLTPPRKRKVMKTASTASAPAGTRVPASTVR
ncbi:MAG: hypothetical protein U0802_13690 [Candidatus Binatia bacterium]